MGTLLGAEYSGVGGEVPHMATLGASAIGKTDRSVGSADTVARMTTVARKPRGQYGKTAARRQEIVDAAVEVFGTMGYNKGSLREVADRVGMSQAGLLHHFPS